MFTKSNYLIKEHVSFLKLVDRYDIIDADSGEIIAHAKENISGLMKFARLLIKKAYMNTTIEIKSAITEEIEYVLKKKAGFLRQRVFIIDKNSNTIGYFKSRVFSLGGRFDVFKMDETKIAEVKGNWNGWNFKFIDTNGQEIGLVTKKWAGIGKEFLQMRITT